MKNFSITEFRPTIFFLVKFIGLYLVMNLLYGLYVTAYYPQPDPVTHVVSKHTSFFIAACGWSTTIRDGVAEPITAILYENRSVLSVYEGCNGLNIMIIFVAFIIAFGPMIKALLWFIPAGLLIIHGVNLLRIGMLFYVARYMPDFMYFTHKYFFTAILYVVIFALWIWWVRKFSIRKM